MNIIDMYQERNIGLELRSGENKEKLTKETKRRSAGAIKFVPCKHQIRHLPTQKNLRQLTCRSGQAIWRRRKWSGSGA
jgi:hypothetical protein